MSDAKNNTQGVVGLAFIAFFVVVLWKGCDGSSPNSAANKPQTEAAPRASASTPAATPFNAAREWKKMADALNCPNRMVNNAMPALGYGKMYSCVGGKAQTVKLFVNEELTTGGIKDIKLMWNDWHTDAGHGLHADQKTARDYVKRFSELYAPELVAPLSAAFFTDHGAKFQSGVFQIEYRFTPGPRINERLLVFTPSQ